VKDAWFDFCRCSESAPFRMWIDLEIWTNCLPAAIELPLQAPMMGGFFCTGTGTGAADVVCHHWPPRFLRGPCHVAVDKVTCLLVAFLSLVDFGVADVSTSYNFVIGGGLWPVNLSCNGWPLFR